MRHLPTPDYGIDLPGGWYAYEPDRAGRLASIARRVDARIDFDPGLAPARSQLVEILTLFAASADEAGARLAATFWEPGPEGAVAANLMIFDGTRTVIDSIDGEVADLVERLARSLDSDVGPREVTVVKLAAGPAVRLRLLARTEVCGYGEPDTVLDVIQYWVPAPHHPTNVVVSAETPCLDLDDHFATTVAGIASTLFFAG